MHHPRGVGGKTDYRGSLPIVSCTRGAGWGLGMRLNGGLIEWWGHYSLGGSWGWTATVLVMRHWIRTTRRNNNGDGKIVLQPEDTMKNLLNTAWKNCSVIELRLREDRLKMRLWRRSQRSSPSPSFLERHPIAPKANSPSGLILTPFNKTGLLQINHWGLTIGDFFAIIMMPLFM